MVDGDGDVAVWTWPFNQAHIARQVILCLAFLRLRLRSLTNLAG